VKIYGDFFGVGDMEEVEELLTGKPYSKQAIEMALENIDVPKYFGGISKEELVQLIY
jgi:lipoate-protein ligase A